MEGTKKHGEAPSEPQALDPDKLNGPGGLTLRQVHEQLKASAARDRKAQLKTANSLAQTGSRWQRFVRYAWGRSGRR